MAFRRGDPTALEWFNSLWVDYENEPISCFLCDAETDHPPFTVFLPDYADKTQVKMIAVPLCNTCQSIPTMSRLSKCFRILKRMSGNKKLAFHFVR
jgi:hypothetical protein